ncbi:MAG: hypothetical protein N2556_04555 [Anaerolineae bacterium]|nr:hypothetical protein [Anaerolineae bacterium]
MLDKELYRQAYEQYRRWNEAEEAERAHDARRLSPQEAWRRYVELVEFCWKLCPQRSETERQEKLAALERYYESVQRLEEWRRARRET